MTKNRSEPLRCSFKNWSKLFPREESALSYYKELCSLYRENQRHYHTLSHIEHCLELFDQYHSCFQYPDHVEISLWTHDIIYNPLLSNNEQESANWAQACLIANNYSNESCQEITDLILATANHSSSNSDSALMNDIDLSILGSDTHTFSKYCHNIRQEYHFVEYKTYQKARISILEQFLTKPQIYNTVQFQQRFEEQARANLEREITLLSQDNSST